MHREQILQTTPPVAVFVSYLARLARIHSDPNIQTCLPLANFHGRAGEINCKPADKRSDRSILLCPPPPRTNIFLIGVNTIVMTASMGLFRVRRQLPFRHSIGCLQMATSTFGHPAIKRYARSDPTRESARGNCDSGSGIDVNRRRGAVECAATILTYI